MVLRLNFNNDLLNFDYDTGWVTFKDKTSRFDHLKIFDILVMVKEGVGIDTQRLHIIKSGPVVELLEYV